MRLTLLGGTRSPDGSAMKLATAALFGTRLARGQEPAQARRQSLRSPHV